MTGIGLAHQPIRPPFNLLLGSIGAKTRALRPRGPAGDAELANKVRRAADAVALVWRAEQGSRYHPLTQLRGQPHADGTPTLPAHPLTTLAPKHAPTDDQTTATSTP